MNDFMIIQIITVITLYCNGPGQSHESNFLGKAPARCFEKIWSCAHKVSDALAVVTEMHNCIGRHSAGKMEQK